MPAPRARVKRTVFPMGKVYAGPAIAALYGQLVEDFGGGDAAAAFLQCSKSTISKEINGHCAVAPQHFAALEDRLGRWPITDLLYERRERRAALSDVEVLVARVVRENGDLANALVGFLTHGDAGAVIKEGREANGALEDLLAAVEREAGE